MKPIQNFPNYFVTKEGQIWSKKNNLFLKPSINSNGYLIVNLYNDEYPKGITKLIHRLVAETYLPNPLNLPMINHKDENKQNNELSNLEWCDSKYNNNYGTAFDTKKKKVKCIETNIIYESTSEAARKTGLSQQNISAVCNHKRQTTGGFHWQFI